MSWCDLRFPTCVNALLHCEQLCSFPQWMCICIFKEPFAMNRLLHCSHLKSFFLSWVNMWFDRLLPSANDFEQKLQELSIDIFEPKDPGEIGNEEHCSSGAFAWLYCRPNITYPLSLSSLPFLLLKPLVHLVKLSIIVSQNSAFVILQARVHTVQCSAVIASNMTILRKAFTYIQKTDDFLDMFQGGWGHFQKYGDSFAIWRQLTCRHIAIFQKSDSLFSESHHIDRCYIFIPPQKTRLCPPKNVIICVFYRSWFWSIASPHM